MSRHSHNPFSDGFPLPQPSPSDLRGRQSVRATFKLSSRAIEALSIVAVQLGVKQKSLFDHLLEDLEALEVIAREVDADDFKTVPRVQKTYVLSRRTLVSLDRASKTYRAPRDALVEFSIRRLLPVIERERRRHAQRKQMQDEFFRYLEQGKRMLAKYRRQLGRDDPLCDLLENVLVSQDSAHEQMAAFIDRCRVIEEF